ncbi:MAG TPA: family 31 glucosidase [Actinobacteria bacterium]|jgi:alpha-D-xyloside xylohydrolase|nr:family 31 glucosidase [Actinomycetota bacterium]
MTAADHDPLDSEQVPDMAFSVRSTGITLHLPAETIHIDAWGDGTIRVRAFVGEEPMPIEEGLVVHQPSAAVVAVAPDGSSATVTAGPLTALIERHGRMSFSGPDGVLTEEPWFDFREPPLRAHRYYPRNPDGSRGSELTLRAFDNERLYGLGQHTIGRLDLKGSVIDLLQRNSQIAVPVIVSSRGYGMLWNSPSVGRVELAANHTRWVAHEARQLDYFIYSGGTPAEILGRYHALTGFPPPIPHWATGYWQSNSFYPDQETLVSVVREHLSRGLPLAAMFVDYMHWTRLGEWEWDTEKWPDPQGMVAELREAGVHLMVAVWPHVSPRSKHYPSLLERGLLVRSTDGSPAVFSFADRELPGGVDVALLDLTNPDARTFYWERIEENYHRIGVRAFWLDASEPELTAEAGRLFEDESTYSLGHGTEVSSLFALEDARAVREGLDSVGDTESMLLVRSGWAGIQRYGAAVWSGDIQSTWESLRLQVSAGLNVMASGIPWWTSDIGGFFGAEEEGFDELLVRWFQFATFWPVVRMHGNRHPDFFHAGIFSAGGPNEIWAFGDRGYEIMRGLLAMRESLRPYVHSTLELTSTLGIPPVRPLWFDHDGDPRAVSVDDQFMFGPDLLVAPVLAPGVEGRSVYLPHGRRWRSVWTQQVHEGGEVLDVAAPLHIVPLFVAEGSGLDRDGVLRPDSRD